MCTYLAATLSGMSTRGTRVPTSLYWLGGLRGAVPVNLMANGLPPINSP